MPIAALAACGIFFGLTAALMKTQVQEAVPFLSQPVVFFIISTLYKVSSVVFTLLPVMFAISIAFGLAKEEKEVAAFAGFVGYYTFLVGAACMMNSGFMDFSALKISVILGVETLDMGAVAGIITGIVTAALHNRFHKITFPVAIAFYGGKRFVALIVIITMGGIGLVAPIVWEPISMAINGLGGLLILQITAYDHGNHEKDGQSGGKFNTHIFSLVSKKTKTDCCHIRDGVIGIRRYGNNRNIVHNSQFSKTDSGIMFTAGADQNQYGIRLTVLKQMFSCFLRVKFVYILAADGKQELFKIIGQNGSDSAGSPEINPAAAVKVTESPCQLIFRYQSGCVLHVGAELVEHHPDSEVTFLM